MNLDMSELEASSPGGGAVVWGDATGLRRLHPSKSAYGGAEGYEEEKQAFELSLAADRGRGARPGQPARDNGLEIVFLHLLVYLPAQY